MSLLSQFYPAGGGGGLTGINGAAISPVGDGLIRAFGLKDGPIKFRGAGTSTKTEPSQYWIDTVGGGTTEYNWSKMLETQTGTHRDLTNCRCDSDIEDMIIGNGVIFSSSGNSNQYPACDVRWSKVKRIHNIQIKQVYECEFPGTEVITGAFIIHPASYSSNVSSGHCSIDLSGLVRFADCFVSVAIHSGFRLASKNEFIFGPNIELASMNQFVEAIVESAPANPGELIFTGNPHARGNLSAAAQSILSGLETNGWPITGI